MTTESERRVTALLGAAGFHPSSLGIDRDEAWAKFFHNGQYEVISASYDVDTADECVASELVERAVSRGMRPRPH